MTTSTDTVAEILRPLAERRLLPDGYFITEYWNGVPLRSTPFDGCFEALRSHYTGYAGAHGKGPVDAWEVDTSLGAFARAMAACGLEVDRIAQHGAFWDVSIEWRQKAAYFHGGGATPEEAWARALVAAVAAQESVVR